MDCYNFISKEDEFERFIRKDENPICKQIYDADNIIERYNLRESVSAEKPIIVAKINNLPKPFNGVTSSRFPKQWLTVSFKEFGDLAKAYAYVLKKRYNLMPKDRVAIMADSTPSNHLIIFALWFLRVTVIQISTVIGNDIRQFWMRLNDVKMVFYDKTFKPFYEEHKALNEDEWIWKWIHPLNKNEQNLCSGKEGILLVNMSSEVLADEILDAKEKGNFLQLKGQPDDCLAISGTSSSTQAVIKNGQCSTMKFVPLFNNQICIKYCGHYMKNTPPESVYYILAPFSYSFGLFERTCHPIRMGGPLVYRTQTEEDLGIVPEIILDDITEVNIDVALIMPFMYGEFKKFKEQNHPKWPKWEKMFKTRPKGCFVTGGAPIARDVSKWLADELNICVSEHYGSTESGLMMYTDGDTRMPGEEGYLKKLPWIDVYLKPLNDDDKNIGELYIRSLTVFPGYLKRLEEGEISNSLAIPGFRTNYLAEDNFEIIEGKKFFKINDIFRRNPITGKYKYMSRSDDIIAFSTGLKMNPLPFEEAIKSSCDNVKISSLILDNTKTEVVCFVEPNWNCIKMENGEVFDDSKDASQMTSKEIKQLSKLAQNQVWDSILELLSKESGNLSSWAKQLTKENIYIIKYGEKFPVTEKGSPSKRVARLKYSEVLRDITKIIHGEVDNKEIALEKAQNENKDQNEYINKNDTDNKSDISNTDNEENDLQKMIITIYQSLKEHSMSFLEFKDFNPEKSFKNYGVDSLAIMKFTKTLSRKLNKTYSPTILYNYGTPLLLAKYLVNEPTNTSFEINRTLSSQFNNNGERSIGNSRKIAIIGMGLRLPGSIDSESSFWSALVRGKDCLSSLPKDRRLHIGYVNKPTENLQMGEHNIPRCGYYDTRNNVAKPTQFDASFFNCSLEEAVGLDVKHRWILETSWEALESAGIAPNTLENSETGVFIGVNEGQEVKDLLFESGAERAVGLHNSGPSTIAGRLSYFYKLYGPSVTVDTACSTGATALHDACRAMIYGDCNLSIVSASKFMYSSTEFSQISKARMTSPNGRCATFDAEADGFAQSEGCVTFILKNLEDAERDNDNILGVILGTSTGQSGVRQSISSPSSEGQARNIRRALNFAGVDPSQVSYIEAHGTGTPLGDAIEIHGINQIYEGSHTKENPLIVGSVKTNIGHTCEAAGLAGLAKVLVAMKHKTIPKNIHLNKLNPEIEFDKVPIKVPTHNIPWNVQNENEGRIAQISSFGLQGSVVNIIVQEYVSNKNSTNVNEFENKNVNNDNKDKHALIVSAKTNCTLINMCDKYVSILNGMDNDESVASLCYTTNIGRQHFEKRIIALGNTPEELSEDLQLQLDEFLENNMHYKNIDSNSENGKTIESILANRKLYKSIAIVCSENIFEEIPENVYKDVCYLYSTQPVFKDAIDLCDRLCTDISQSKVLLLNIITTLGESKNEEYINGWKKEINENEYIIQFVLLSIHYAISKLLEYLGISQRIVIGHKFGEITAAVLSEKLTLKAAFSLIQHINEWKKLDSIPTLNKMIEMITNWTNEPESTENQANYISERTNKKSKKIFYSCNSNTLYKENEKLTIKYWVSSVRKMLKINNDKSDNLSKTNFRENFTKGCEEVLKAYEKDIITIINISINNNMEEQLNECISRINESKSNLTLIPQYSLYQINEQNEALYECIRQLFIKGVEINWDNFHKRYIYGTKNNYNLSKVLLPFYQFQRSRFWPLEKN